MKEQARQIKNLAELEAAKNEEEQRLLGIEKDFAEDEENDDLKIPYDADKIRVDSNVFSVFQIKRLIDRGMLDLMPAFQRKEVWDIRRKSLLIESLMLRIPIPAFYFDEDNDSKKTVIDGLQRLSAINSYMNDEFSLTGLQYLQEECGGRLFSELQQKYQTRIEDAQLTVNILDSRSPKNVKFDIFRRVNTGGIPLNAQEIRNVMASDSTRQFLLLMAGSSEFLKATRNRVNDIRMDAQELCLRFIAFYSRYNPTTHTITDLQKTGIMLDQCIETLNQSTEQERSDILSAFKASMGKCAALFGKKAFTKPPKESIVNKVLFTSWAVVLTGYPCSTEKLKALQSKAVSCLSSRLQTDAEYFMAVSSSTGTKTSIKKQFETANQIMEELLNDAPNSD